MTPRLRDAVERAYTVFAPYGPVDGEFVLCFCPVCSTREEARRLAALPLREWRSEDLAKYVNSCHSLTEPRAVNDLRYVLPRLFEAIAGSDWPLADLPELNLRHLGDTAYRTAGWPAAEIEAVDEFFDALVADHAASAELFGDDRFVAPYLTQTLELISTAGGDLPRVLATWENCAEPSATLHMAYCASDLRPDAHDGDHSLAIVACEAPDSGTDSRRGSGEHQPGRMRDSRKGMQDSGGVDGAVTAQLREAVERAYDVFLSHRPVDGRVVVCPCCVDDEVMRHLATSPLRKLNESYLADYLESAHVFGDPRTVADLRYLLPRCFEVIAQGGSPHRYGLEISLRRLREASFPEQWPAVEVEAVDDCFTALVADRVSRYAPRQPIAEVLGMIIVAGGDLPRALAVWDAVPGDAPAIHFADCARGLRSDDEGLALDSVWLTEHHAACLAVGAWLRRDAVIERIRAAFFAATDARVQQILSEGEAVLTTGC